MEDVGLEAVEACIRACDLIFLSGIVYRVHA